MKNYYKALAGFQQECPVLLKQSDGFNYKYIDLPKIIHTINPLMKKHTVGIQNTVHIQSQLYLAN